jgi:transposase
MATLIRRAAAYGWLHRFNAEGLKGLTDRPRPGRPVTYTADQRAEVVAALTRPEDLGLPFASWTGCRRIWANARGSASSGSGSTRS